MKDFIYEGIVPIIYGELVNDPKNRKELIKIIDSFGPMHCNIMTVDSESLADIIEDAISGNID